MTDLARQAVEALRAAAGSKTNAAKALGLARTTFRHRLETAARHGLLTETFAVEKPFSVTHELPDPELPLEDLIQRRISEFNRKSTARQARKLIDITVKIDGPIAISHFGDPHVDDPGSNLGLLEQHIKIVNKTEGMFGANVGDLQNLWIGRLARLYANQATTATESWRLAEWLVRSVHWLYLIKGNHDCNDSETEALTRRGWLRHTDIRDDDLILSLDTETGAAHWHPILTRVERENTEDMIGVDLRGVSMRVTQQHRVLSKRKGFDKMWRPLGYVAASKLSGYVGIPVSGAASVGQKTLLSDDQIALAGWVLTDGNIFWSKASPDHPHMSIYQSKNSDEIVRLLSALNLEHRVYRRQRGMREICGKALLKQPKEAVEFHLSVAATRRVLEWLPEKGKLPDWANDLSDCQFEILLAALMAGDGSWNSDGRRNSGALHGTLGILESVQSVAVQHGWSAHLALSRGKDWRLNLSRRRFIEMHSAANKKVYPPSPVVWCLTVPLGNFMVRRNGAAYFTGNCWAGAGDPLDFIIRPMDSVMEPHGARLNLRFPNGRQVRINARHDFQGHSMWNTAHGPAKAAQMGWRDHILTCGHKHVSGYHPVMDPASGLISHAIRVGAYKRIDDYADAHGMMDQNFSENITTIINPAAKDEKDLVTVIFDVEMAAEFLTYLRKKKGA